MRRVIENRRPISRLLILTLAALACSYLWCGAIALAGVVLSFQGLGDLPGVSFFSVAFATSADGGVVVERGTSASVAISQEKGGKNV